MTDRDARDESTGATTRPPGEDADEAALVRHEEELGVETRWTEAGGVRARKRVETEHVEETVPREVEDLEEVVRTAPNEQDSGEVETLPDGSVSIPILEEELVVTKRTVVRERVIVRKRTVTEQKRVEAEIRKERIELEVDEGVEVERGDEGELPPRP